ncbi:hypothetical protein ACTTZI_004174 [Vibrio vulnificus]
MMKFNRKLLAVVVAASFVVSPAFADIDSEMEMNVPVKVIRAIPLSAKAQELIRHSQTAVVETARKNALQARSEANEFDDGNYQMTPVPVIQPNAVTVSGSSESQIASNETSDSKSITGFNSDSKRQGDFEGVSVVSQLRIKSITRVGKKVEAIVMYGRELIPLVVGTSLDSAVVIEITDSFITFVERGTITKRYVEAPKDPVVQSETQTDVER